jgi:hypothetical protein
MKMETEIRIRCVYKPKYANYFKQLDIRRQS